MEREKRGGKWFRDFVKGEWPRDFVKGRRGEMVQRPYAGGEGGRRQGTKLPKLPKLTTHFVYR